LIRILYTWTNV